MSIIYLNNVKSVILYPTAPFNFDYTVIKPSHFKMNNMVYQSGMIHFTTCFNKCPVGIRMINKGSVESPKIELSVYCKEVISEEFMREIVEEIEWRADIKMNLNLFYEKARKDKFLRPVIERRYGMKIMTTHSLYEYIIVTIVLQNATIGRTVKMMDSLINSYGYKVSFDGKELFCLWSPDRIENVDEQELRDLRIGYRAKFIKRISTDFCNQVINEKELRNYKDDQLKKELLKLYGIGKASVWYIMFELYHRYNALVTISPWEQKIYSKLLYKRELVDTKQIEKRVTRMWGKWRMLAIHYIFEDLFWRREDGEEEWLDKYINL